MKPEFTSPVHAPAESGVLRLEAGVIRYTSPNYGSFSVPLHEIAVIGEYTTDSGPMIDDWFDVFVHKNGVDWFEASMYAEGSADFHEQLSAALGCGVELGLAASTDFDSRVIWPPTIAGRPLFEFTPAVRPGILGRIQSAILTKFACRLSAEVLSLVHPEV
jgi:hypothetical protein